MSSQAQADEAPVAAGPPSGLAAGVVLFQPNRDVLERLLDAVEPCVNVIYLFVNAIGDAEVFAALAGRAKTRLIVSQVNFGIGEALNVIVLHAALDGIAQVVLFDQDSSPTPDVVPRLRTAWQALADAGQTPAVVGPRLVAPAEGGYKAPRYFPQPGRAAIGSKRPVRFVPTSGSLISVEAFRRIGAFRGDYFIDAIDLEWCFRAWGTGFSCWCAETVPMVHTVGEGVLEARALAVKTPLQRDFRFETYVRNTVYGFRLTHIPASWKLRQAVYLALQFLAVAYATGFRASVMRRFGKGLVDGLRGRLGPPDGALYT